MRYFRQLGYSTLLIMMFCYLVITCKNNSLEDKVKSEIREYVKNNFDDPDSYSPVEFSRIDSIKYWQVSITNATSIITQSKDYLTDSFLNLKEINFFR